MAHTQTRMAARVGIARGSAEAVNQEIAQTFFRARQIAGRIQPSENVVPRNLPVKGRDQPPETVLADNGIDLAVLCQFLSRP
jgi:hypothetical protein